MNQQLLDLGSKAKEIIDSSNNILLHFHPGPDGDSIGSSLSMMFLLKKLGKDVTVISGDTPKSNTFKILPGYSEVIESTYVDIIKNRTATSFDLFIILDSSAPDRISSLEEVKFPEGMKTLVIDHHNSNQNFGDLNIVDPRSASTGEILFELFKLWNVEITPQMAINLFIAISTDTGGFKYDRTTSRTFEIAAELAAIYPDFSTILFELDNNNSINQIKYEKLALSSLETLFGGKVAMASVSYGQFQKEGIESTSLPKSEIANKLKAVVGFEIGISAIERERGVVDASFRTRDPKKYDLSVLAVSLGGGGHAAAAGVSLKTDFNSAKKQIIEKIAQTFPELGNP